MNCYEVYTKPQLMAAIRACACLTHAEAKRNPATIVWGSTTYTFKDGLHERRANIIVRNIRRTRVAA